MKILIAATPLPGHLDPLLAVGRILAARGHEVAVQTATALAPSAVRAGFRVLPTRPAADIDFRDFDRLFPKRAKLEPGPEMILFDFETIFAGLIPEQAAGLDEALAAFPADIVLHDNLFCGALPMLLGRRAERPRVAACGITFLTWERPDHAPIGIGLPPAQDEADRERYAAIRTAVDGALLEPVQALFDRTLARVGARSLPTRWTDALVSLPDAFLQPTVPEFEYPRDALPATFRFIGGLPAPTTETPLPDWWDDVARADHVVLVTQGTVANADLGALVGPALEALADAPGVLVIVTTGGRPLDAIPGPLPANARAARYLPFAAVLPAVDVLVTNGGYGTVGQALARGIPIVAAGRTEDKAEVSARIAWSGAGLDLATDRPDPAVLRQAVMRVIVESRFRDRAMALAASFGRLDPRREAPLALGL